MTCGIARAICTPTGEGYVFSSVNCELYYKSLISAGRNGELRTFQEAFDEHGPSNFRLDILETCSPTQLRERKIHYLNLPHGSELNLDRWKASRGGERRRERFEWLTMNEIAKLQWLIPSMRGKMTAGIREAQARPEVRAKMCVPRPDYKISPEHREKMLAGQRTPEARARMSEAHKGVALSPEHRAHLAEALRRPEIRAKIGAAGKGRKHTSEARAKIGAASKDRLASPEARAMLRARSTGQKHSPEAKARMSALAKTRLATPEGRARMLAAAEKARSAKRTAKITEEPKTEVGTLRRARWKPSPEHQAKLDAANRRRKEEAARRRAENAGLKG